MRHRHAFTLVETMILAAVLLVGVALAIPGFKHLREKARHAQNSMQLGGIGRMMESYALFSKFSGGWFPGLDRSTGGSIPVSDVIPARQLGASADVPEYATTASANVLPDEMNASADRGFLVRAMADLIAGDYIPAHSASFFINPADTVKTGFLPGDPGPAGRFTAANISYTVLDVSKNDGGVFPLKAGWNERADGNVIVVADRAVGDGNDLATRSSVWTEPRSGAWEGWAALRDGSTLRTFHPGSDAYRAARFDGIGYAPGSTGNVFGRGLKLIGTPPAISPTSGSLYDEPDTGTDPDAF